MDIIVGSKNPTKIRAVESVFPNHTIISLDVPTGVSSQPFSDGETKQGAINRAKECANSSSNALGIGLEGGVMYVEDELYLCNWGALVTPNEQIFTAAGARIWLPTEIETQLKAGFELGELMDHYAEKQAVRNNEGAVGIFTNDLISRQEMFSHVVKLIKGQWIYWNKESQHK